MKFRISGVILAFVIVVSPHFAYAAILVSEIMFDLETGSDSGREWIEVFNAGSQSTTLTDFKLFEANTNHAITEFTGGAALASGAYAIIADNPAKFMADWPSYSGLLFDSAFSLSNSGESLAIRYADLTDSDSVSYTGGEGAAGDGKSFQRQSSNGSSFSAAPGTPGTGLLAVTGADYTPPQTEASPQSSSKPSASVSSYVAPLEPVLFAYAGRDRDEIAGAAIEFVGRAYDRNGDALDSSKTRFLWTFGDGATGEGERVQHVFKQPGKYAVVLDLARGFDAASDQVVVTARPVEASVSVVNGEIAVHNTSARDLDLSEWILESGGKMFMLPARTIVLAGATVVFSQDVTKLVTNGKEATLRYPNGTTAVIAGASIPLQESPKIVHAASAPKVVMTEPKEIMPTSTPVQHDTFQTAAASEAVTETSLYVWVIGALALTLIGAASAYLVRKEHTEWEIEEIQ